MASSASTSTEDPNLPSIVTNLLGSQRVRLLAELHDVVASSTSTFWRERSAGTLLLPLTTGSASSPMGRGSDSTPVVVQIGSAEVFLADSMQFYLELGVRILGRTAYYVMPSFRGELADATHLPQFFHSEAELVGGLDDVIETSEAYLRFVTSAILRQCSDRLEADGIKTAHLEGLAQSSSFPRLSFEEVVRVVPSYVEAHDGWRSLSKPGERALMEHCGGPVWMTHFDHLAVPFYQAFLDERRLTAMNADLLFGLGEVIGAGQRHAVVDDVLRALKMHDVEPSRYQWYLEMKRLAPLCTAGFGMGVERFLAWVLQVEDIREVQLIRRDQPQVIQL